MKDKSRLERFSKIDNMNKGKLKLTKPIAEKIIQKGWALLEDSYNQEELRNAMSDKGVQISSSALSNIYRKYLKSVQGSTSGRAPGKGSLITCAEGVLLEVESHLGLLYNVESSEFYKPEAEAEAVSVGSDTLYLPNKLRFHEDGRRTIADKVKFIQEANREVIEIGIRLNTFTKYFYSRNELEFKKPIESLLEKGVEIKCLMLNPTAQITKLYFEDRAKVDSREWRAFHEMPQVLEDLKNVRNELNALDFPGKMRLFLYENFPYHHYLVVDPDEKAGRMMCSNYIYGEKRANCPVIEIYQYGSKDLFTRHRNAIQNILSQAIEI